MKRRRFLSLLPAVPLAMASLPATLPAGNARSAALRGFWRGYRSGWETKLPDPFLDALRRSLGRLVERGFPMADRWIAEGASLQDARAEIDQLIQEDAQ